MENTNKFKIKDRVIIKNRGNIHSSYDKAATAMKLTRWNVGNGSRTLVDKAKGTVVGIFRCNVNKRWVYGISIDGLDREYIVGEKGLMLQPCILPEELFEV